MGLSTALPEVDGRPLTVCRTHYRPRNPEHERARVRRIVYSSSSDSESEGVPPKPGPLPRHGNDDDDDGIIEITDSSDDDDQRVPKPLSARVGVVLLPLLPPAPERRQHGKLDDDGLLVL